MFQKTADIRFLVIAGIGVMLLLFVSFLISFIINQRKKLQYHKDLQSLRGEQQQILTEQNILLDKKVKERTAELIQQKEALQQSLSELKLAQLQLIQQEKMASLGELTAGIAHEIQNPLNFVNNFSEINTELLAEMKDHLSREKLSSSGEQQINNLTRDVTENLKKIIHHGRRADFIVKACYNIPVRQQGKKELTDLNRLTEEYLQIGQSGISRAE